MENNNKSLGEEVHQMEEELEKLKLSINALHGNLYEQNQRKVNVSKEVQQLRRNIKVSDDSIAEILVTLLRQLKALESEESNFQSYCNTKQSELRTEVLELEDKMCTEDNNQLASDLDNTFCNALAKTNLAPRLRAILLLKRQLDDVPSQTELIQYGRRFSELYIHIQQKLQKTRQYYGTYNALLEMKQLMLKETSLLNSTSSQFQATSAGRAKLVDSMENIVKGTQQKLEKVQVSLQAEQKVCDALKEKYAALITEQRHCSSLLKAFKEECVKNDRLRCLCSSWRRFSE